MDEMLKLYLEKIEASISELKDINKLQIDNVNEKLNEIKDTVNNLREKVEEIQIKYIDYDDMEKKTEKLVTKEFCNANQNCETPSVKKITLICAGVSTICTTLIEIVDKLVLTK